MPKSLILILDGFHRKIGPRSLVWSEKEYVEDAEYEFSEVSLGNIISLLILSSEYYIVFFYKQQAI